MCGRFTQRYTWDEIQELYSLMGAASNLQAHYNIAPTDTVDVVKPAHDGANGLGVGRPLRPEDLDQRWARALGRTKVL